MSKDCEKCGGKGAVVCWAPVWDSEVLYAKLCPCVTERMAKLERVAEAAKNLLEMYDEVHWRDPERDIESALKALEETK